VSESGDRTDLASESDATEKAVEFVASSRLRRGASAHQIQGLFRKIDLVLDTKIGEAQARQPHPVPIACHAGCDHCCHRVVFSTDLEAMAAAIHIQQRFSNAQKEALEGNLAEYAKHIGPKMGRDLGLDRRPCPLLEDGLCSIYEVRPISCRSQFSASVEACREARDNPGIEFPASQPESAIGSAAAAGLRSGMSASGLWPNSVDFARVLGIVLTDEEACEYYRSGQAIFEIAEPVAEVKSHPLAQPTPKHGGYGEEEEATGQPDDSCLTQARFLLKADGDAESAFAQGPVDSALHQMFRMQVPLSYGHTDEIEYWRNRMIRAFEEFKASPFDAREKFDAISVYNPLSLSYQQRNDKELLSDIGDYLTHEISATVFPDLCRPLPKRRRQGKLKVGYIAAQLSQTSGSYWASGWLKNHSKDVEAYAYYLAPTLDPGAVQYQRYAHKFYHCPGPVGPTARLIKEQNLDVLIYPDVTAEARSIQFATLRLAPVQCAAWGCPETTGLPNVDYFLSSEWMEPEYAQAHYREMLVLLPGAGICYPRPSRSGMGWTKSHFGLDDGPLYLCTQLPPKLLPQWDGLFREICDRTGRPIVFFSYPYTAAAATERRLKAAGVRAIFMPILNVMQFYDLLALADATLDSVGWSGGITTLLTLQQGRPVITLPGEFRRGRQSMAFLRAANAPGLIAADANDYVDLAINADRRQSALETMHPDALFDNTESVRALEDFLFSACRD